MTPNIPCAGGTAAADISPINPLRMSKVSGELEKPAPSAKMENKKRDDMKSVLRPKRSAMRAKRRRKEPLAKLKKFIEIYCLSGVVRIDLR